MVQVIDDAEAARRAALEQHQQRVAGAIARVEALAASTTTAATAEQIDEAEAGWRGLSAAATHEISEADRARFDSAVTAARAILEREARERAEQEQRQAELAAGRAARVSMCELVEELYGEDALDRLERARSEWEGLPQDPEAAMHEQFMRRFEQACARAMTRHENRQESARTNVRLDELSKEAEQLAAQEDSPAYAWDSISREWRTLLEKTEGIDEAVQQRYAAAETAIRERAEAKKAAAEKAIRQQVQRIDQLIERAHKRAEAEDLTLKEADKAARDLRTAIETPLTLPHHEREYLVERLKAALAALAPKLHELREMDEWKRFANAAVQEEMIAQAEALGKKYDLEKPEDMEKAARELHDIQERWKQAAEAPRAQAQTLWHRYRQAADPIQAKAREFFAARAVEREANLKLKLELCERAEAIADSTDWIKTAEEMKKLQAEWQASGPVPRPDTRVVWKRFRDACDRFFTRRNEDLAQRKEVWATNQARKEALCARAEELAQSREWDKAASELRRLQAEWKTIGPVRRTKSEVALAALPDRRGPVLRSLQAARRDRDRVAAGGPRGACRGAGIVPAVRGRRGRGRRAAARPAREGALAAHAVESVHDGRPPGRGPAQRTLHERDGARADEVSRSVQVERARRRREPPAHGEAGGAAGELRVRERGQAGVVAGSRRAPARSAGVEHDWRPRRRRVQVARHGR